MNNNSNNNEDAVNQVLTDYYKAFSTLTIQSILRYFHQPALLIGPSGVIALPTPEAVVPIFGPVMEGLRQREYHRSEFSLQQLRLLSAPSALAMGWPYGTRLMIKKWSGRHYLPAA